MYSLLEQLIMSYPQWREYLVDDAAIEKALNYLLYSQGPNDSIN